MYSHCASRFLITIILLLATLSSFLSSFGQNSTDSEIQQRIIYITPEDSCPVEHCYRLEHVLSNSSYFFDSYTTLELLPGEYNITEKVGQLVLVEVVNFTLKGSSPNVTITCQPGATWGLTIIKSLRVEISNVQIYKCFANLPLEGRNNTILTAYNKQVGQYLEYDLSSCDAIASIEHPACHAYLTIFKNKKVTIYQTFIFYSRGVGIFSIDNNGLQVSQVVLAYNQINCINYNMLLDTTSSTFNMSHSQINCGQIKSYSFEFASGLNLFVHLNWDTHNISLTNITLTNNRGTNGNFYMAVRSQPGYSKSIDMNVLITNISSIQTDRWIASPGMVIKYDIRLENTDESRIRERTLSSLLEPWLFSYNPFGYYPTSPLKCNKYSFLYDTNCYPLTWPGPGTQLVDKVSRTKRVYIVLHNGYFKGSCVTIRDSHLSIVNSWFRFEMSSIVINESKCETALSVVDSETKNYLRLSNLLIINSHSNILSVNIPSNYLSKVILTGETYFLSNQGSVSLLSGTLELRDFVLISDNIAQKYESIFQVSDSSQVWFEGEIIFDHNSGRQGGAISAYSSELIFEGNVSFIGNSAAESGGAISLNEGAVIDLKYNTYVMFTGNIADTYGGAIYIEDSAFWMKTVMKCFTIEKDIIMSSLKIIQQE